MGSRAWTSTARLHQIRSAFVCAIAAACLSAACALSPPYPAEEQIVDEEDLVFDPRFRDLDASSLDLSNFWEENRLAEGSEPLPIHQDTYVELVDSVRDGIVNIYTHAIQKRDLRVGFNPVDVLPFRIPVVSALLDVAVFTVPLPFRPTGISLGSGFLINAQGYILTNAHVVHNATDIVVVLATDPTPRPARLIGIDALTDTALIRIDLRLGMSSLPLGDSDSLRVGELVLAVGNPLGLNHTVTSGLVSAKHRLVPTQRAALLDFIQTDSAINPGSSGGPLLNLHGEVVGINTAIVAEAQSIGFAIPINIVKQVMPLLVLNETERGWFGAAVRPIEPDELAELDHKNPWAVVVAEVSENSPAEAAGLQPDDIIVAVGEVDIANLIAFRRSLLSLRPGDPLRLTLLRGGERFDTTGTLAVKPD